MSIGTHEGCFGVDGYCPCVVSAGTTFSSRGGGGGVGASRTQDACLLDSASDVEESAETENRVTVEEEGDSLGVEVADDGDENIVEKRRSGGRVRRGRSRGSLSSSRTGGTRRGRGSQRAPSRAHGDAEEEEEEDDDDDDISTGLDGLHALMHHAEAMSASKPVEEGGLQPPSTSPGPSSDKAGGKRGASRKPSTNKFANSGVPKQSSTTSEDGEVEGVEWSFPTSCSPPHGTSTPMPIAGFLLSFCGLVSVCLPGRH